MFIRVLEWCWRQIAVHWTTILAVVGIVGIIAAELYRPLKDQQSVYFFICLNAIVFTLIRVKVQLDRLADKDDPRNTVRVFATMREARATIIALLAKEVSKRDTGRAVIVGGRIRSIIELIRELDDTLRAMATKSKSGCDIQIFMMSPDFVSSLVLPGNVPAEVQQDRNGNIAATMRGNVQELRGMCAQQIFRDNNVRISIGYYHEVPFGYYYLIGDEDLIFGGYIWSAEQSDLVGPASPCWHSTSKSPEFEPTTKWLHNRAAFFAAQDAAHNSGQAAAA